MKFALMLASSLTFAFFSPITQAQNGLSKCKTAQGTIVIVQGNTCPPGTYWIGPA
jgi:hypothetical protein